MSSAPNVVIVDSYAPTKRLADEFGKAGAGLIRVQSTVDVPAVYQGPFDVSGYLSNVIHDGDLAATAQAVAAYKPVAVVAGGEVGVEFADALADRLGLASNGVELSAARRDKYLMIETVRRAGLAAARQRLIEDPAEAAEWHRTVGGRIVLKPVRSAGGNGVRFCDDPDQSLRAATQLLAEENIFSRPNTALVAQEYLRGTEYMVNTVSRDGHHRVCEIWRTTRIAANGVLDLSDTVYLMPASGAVQDSLAEYAGRALDALGIRHGPAHVEIKLTSAGPVLVEVGARICGANLPHYAQVAQSSSQLDWTVAAYLRPSWFLENYAKPRPPALSCAFVGLVSPVAGVLRGYRHLDRIRQLESLYELNVVVQPGSTIKPTVDDVSYPALVILMHECEETVLHDANTIRYLDGTGMYDVDPAQANGSEK